MQSHAIEQAERQNELTHRECRNEVNRRDGQVERNNSSINPPVSCPAIILDPDPDSEYTTSKAGNRESEGALLAQGEGCEEAG